MVLHEKNVLDFKVKGSSDTLHDILVDFLVRNPILISRTYKILLVHPDTLRKSSELFIWIVKFIKIPS